MDYVVTNIIYNTDNYDKQCIVLDLPKSIVVNSGFLQECVHHNLVQTKQALVNYLQGLYGFEILDCCVERLEK